MLQVANTKIFKLLVLKLTIVSVQNYYFFYKLKASKSQFKVNF